MKKHKIFGFVIAAVVLVTTACSDDFLQEKRDLSGVNEEVYQQPLLAQQYIDYVYGMFLPTNNAQGPIWNLSTGNGDNSKNTMELPGETNWNKPWASISYINGHAPTYFGVATPASITNNPYTRIRQINLFLDNVDKYNTLGDDLKNKLKGQLFFWRAWQYFELVRMYGGVPLILTAQNPIASDASSLQVQRSSTTETFTQIASDLDEAIKLLPSTWGASDFGRISAGAAAAFKGRVLLTQASPEFNGGIAGTEKSELWQKAFDANKAAYDMLVANGSALEANFNTFWFKTGNTNTEAVITFNSNNLQSGNTQRNNGWENAIRSKEQKGGGAISPTREAVDVFPMKDGKFGSASKYTYTLQHFYKDRDPRFYATFAYNGAKWPYSENPNFRLWSYYYTVIGSNDKQATYSTETAGANSTGIYIKKGSNTSASNNGGIGFQYSATYTMEMRFAEVMLNLAESAVGINDNATAMNMLTLIRKRAGVEATDNYGLGTAGTRDQMFAKVLQERRIELAYEGKIYWDMRRWLMFDNTYGTLTRLGMTALNGTRRTGYLISVVNNGQSYIGAKGTGDPLLGTSAPLITREQGSMTDAQYETYLDNLYTNYFKVEIKDNVDPTNVANWKFSWYKEYYFFGFNQSTLQASPYLQQTKGWDSPSGAGTFDPTL